MGGEIPKQYIEVCGRPVIAYCIERFAGHPRIDALIVVLAREWQAFVDRLPEVRSMRQPLHYAEQGETRQLSIYNGLKCAKEQGCRDDDIVIVHDAARPAVSARLIDDCLDACAEYDGAMPVLPVKDTVYQSLDGKTITSLLPRETLYAGQAPEAFRLGKYLAAHRSLPYGELAKINGSSEIAHRQAMRIRLVRGEESNYKITVPEDLERFKLSLKI